MCPATHSPPDPRMDLAWTKVKELMSRVAGNVLSDDQRYLLETRLGPIARREGYGTVPDLVDLACSSPLTSKPARAVLDALTTHETYFFRDTGFWTSMNDEVLPMLFKHGPRPLKIWSAACSTGQEAYSLAILLEERYPEIAGACRIFGTDLSDRVLETARTAIYSTFEVNRGMNARRLLRFFKKAPGGYQVQDRLRQRVSWDTHNLLKVLPRAERFDLILCRNVLIYFDQLDRERAQRNLLGKLTPDGFLGLGCTEIANRVITHQPVAPGWYQAGARRAA